MKNEIYLDHKLIADVEYLADGGAESHSIIGTLSNYRLSISLCEDDPFLVEIAKCQEQKLRNFVMRKMKRRMDMMRTEKQRVHGLRYIYSEMRKQINDMLDWHKSFAVEWQGIIRRYYHATTNNSG